MAQIGVEILPALFGAVAFVAYRFSRVGGASSPKLSGKWEDCDAKIEVVKGRNCSCPEPEPEEPEHEAPPRDSQRIRRQRLHLSSVSIVLIALSCVLLTACLWPQAQVQDAQDVEAGSSTNEPLPVLTPNLAPEVPTDVANSEVVVAPETNNVVVESEVLEVLPTLFADDGASVDLYTEPSTESALDAELYKVKLSRQRMPIYAIGDVVYYRSAYYGTLDVGSPSVAFTVVFDTGSGHLVLPSTYCHTETCRVHRRYRRSQSQSGKDIDYDGTPVAPGSARDQITVSFGTGEVTGVFVEDLVCMDNAPEALPNATNLSVRSDDQSGCVTMRFIAATDMSEDPFKSFQFDGVLGLGLPGLSQTPDFNFLNVVSQSVHSWGGTRNPHTFSVFLAEGNSEDSEIAFGGWSQDRLAEDLGWNRVLMPEMGHWLIEIKSMRVGNASVSFCDEGCKAVVDTGTSLFAVPTVAFPELYEMLKHAAPLLGHCRGDGPELHIELEGSTVTLEPRDYARVERSPPSGRYPSYVQNEENKTETEGPEKRSDVFCKPMLMALDLPEPLGPKLFILGEPVLRKYYTVYDGKAKSVGIGRAKHRAGARPAEFLMAGGDTYARGSIFEEFRRRRIMANK